MWPLLSRALRFLAQAFRRFVEANPQNAYEQAVFTALRTMIITAFLKPIGGNHVPPAPA